MRFPKVHIAESVLERIAGLALQEQQLAGALNQALTTPPAAVPAPPGSEEAALIEMQQGGSAADAIGSLAIIDQVSQ